MFNCGGSIDLFDEFQLHECSHLQLYVCDSHRPFHPSNIANQQQIYLLDDKERTSDINPAVNMETQDADVDIVMDDNSDLDISDEDVVVEPDEFEGLPVVRCLVSIPIH